MRGSGPSCPSCAPGVGPGAGAGAGVPFLVGAAAPGRRKLPAEFEWRSVALSVLGILSVLLGCDMANNCSCRLCRCLIY